MADEGRQGAIAASQFEGWPVYEVTPSSGGASGHVLYIHGGGYVADLQATHMNFIARVAALTDRTVSVPVYPLTPTHTHRSVLPTLDRLYRSMIVGKDMDRFAIMGDSAGATMGLGLVESLPPEKARPHDLILLSPWLDATMSNPEIKAIEPNDPMSTASELKRLARLWAGSDPLSILQLSPINGPLDHLGRVTIFAGSEDILTADARRLAQLATEARGTEVVLHEYEGMTHVFMLLQPGPETDAVMTEIVNRLGGSSSRPKGGKKSRT